MKQKNKKSKQKHAKGPAHYSYDRGRYVRTWTMDYHETTAQRETQGAAWDTEQHLEINLSHKYSQNNDTSTERPICRCVLVQKVHDDQIEINVYKTLDTINVTPESVDVSEESAMGKACLTGIANGAKEIEVARLPYQILDFEVFDQRTVERYAKDEKAVKKAELRVLEYKNFLIRRFSRGCMVKGHTVIDINARIPILTVRGLSYVDVPASYCATCDLYYISEIDFQNAKKKGTIFCRVLDEETYQKLKDTPFGELAPKSVLAMMGYTVDNNHDPGYVIRRQILALVIDKGILTRAKVLDLLTLFINLHSKQKAYADAVRKWEDDRKFVSEYKIGNYQTYGVNSIRRTHYADVPT